MGEPYIPFYPADYLADTMHLTLEEHGAYMKLLMVLWRAGGKLANDDKKICQILGVTPKKWSALKSALQSFFTYDNGEFYQKRLLAERQKAAEKSEKRSQAGSIGGNAKSQKNNDPPQANATDLPEFCHDTCARLPESDQVKEEDDCLARDPVREIFQWCEAEINSPIPMISAPIVAWLNWGADFELDIKPVVKRRLLQAQKDPLRSLAWLDQDIASSIKQRSKAMPEINAPPRYDKAQEIKDHNARVLAEAEKLYAS